MKVYKSPLTNNVFSRTWVISRDLWNLKKNVFPKRVISRDLWNLQKNVFSKTWVICRDLWNLKKMFFQNLGNF